MREVQLYQRDPDVQEGVALGTESYDQLIAGEDTLVRKPDMSPLLILLKGATSREMQERVLPSFRKAATGYGSLENRGTAIGKGSSQQQPKLDGSISKTNRVKISAYPELADSDAGIIGFSDAVARFPYCRQTVFNAEQAAHWDWLQEYLSLGSSLFKTYAHPQWDLQQTIADQTHPAWVIPGTSFTTITVNRNWRTKVHKDKGDLRQGFGVMGVLGNDLWKGCNLIFPEWRVACELRPGDFILDDVHEWHCNSPLEQTGAAYERISVVMYYREKMIRCGSPEEEVAKRDTFLKANPNALTYTKASR